MSETNVPTDAVMAAADLAASALVQGSIKLVSLPHVCIRVNLMVDDPDHTAAEIGVVIQQDASLTARLLKIANSPLYGFRSRVDTISRAVTVIGQRELRDLVFAVSAVRTFAQIPVDLANMASFWRHSIFTGIVAKLLAQECGVLHTERLFVAGLLHDLGKLLIFSKMPEQAQKALRRSVAMDEPVYLAERTLIGFDHGAVGGALAKLWELPSALSGAIRFHHEPDAAPECLEAALVHLANAIAHIAEAPDQREALLARTSQHAWQMSSIDADVIEPVIAKAHPLLFEGLALIMPNE
jgi:putative nucleotidyltransferase with HDIG domain